MYLNKQTKDQIAPMPLIMNYAPNSRIEEESNETTPVIYNDFQQSIIYDMRTVGTKCLKTSFTKVGTQKTAKQDKKNAIDDSKTVK